MNPELNSVKSIKDFANKAVQRIARDNIDVPYTLMLEAISAGLQHRDWNTLSASLKEKTLSYSRPVEFVMPENSSIDEQTQDPLASSIREKLRLTTNTSKTYLFDVNETDKLPFLGIITSETKKSKKWIEDLSSKVSPENKEKLRYIHLNKNSSINPFDTLLGCREPCRQHKEYLVNLLMILLSEIPKSILLSITIKETREILDFAITETYKKCSDISRQGSPRLYTPKVDELVDIYLKHHKIKINPFTLWWTIVGELYERNDIQGALMAQRHAVPILEDLPESFYSEAFKNTYKGKYDHIITSICGRLSEIFRENRGKPINIWARTNVDIGKKQITVVDIQDIIPRFSHGGIRVSLAHMLARKLLDDSCFIEFSDIQNMPEIYQDYHNKNLKNSRQIIYNNSNLIGNDPLVMKQINSDILELGRKDLLVFDFLTKESHQDKQPRNQFSIVTHTLVNIIVSLMDESLFDGAKWGGRATMMLTGVINALVWLHNEGELKLSVASLYDYMKLKKIVSLSKESEYPNLPSGIRHMVKSYLQSLPRYEEEKEENQNQYALDQHGYLHMLLSRVLENITDVYD
jgi:hypothetical protein